MDVSRLVEVAVAERYAKKMQRPFAVVVGFFKEYDVSSLVGDILLEIKFDTMSISTGNVAVEYTFKNEPSGIAATSADCFVFVIPEKNSLWAFEVDVRNLRAQLAKSPLVRGGDNYASTMKLLPVATLKQIASDSFRLELDLGKLKEYWKGRA